MAGLRPCPCGCGKICVRRCRPDLSARNSRREWSPESRRALSEVMSGRKQPPRPVEWCAKLSLSLKERFRKYQHPKKGKPHTAEHSAKIAEANYGRVQSVESRRKISVKMAARWAAKPRRHDYPPEWPVARLLALVRDGFRCICGSDGAVGKCKRPDVHHIDHDKSNCALTNLITLCKSCHGSVHLDQSWEETLSAMAYWREHACIRDRLVREGWLMFSASKAASELIQAGRRYAA